jgi:hypothetical protein
MASVNVTASATNIAATASTSDPTATTSSFVWSVDNGNWSVSPSRTDSTVSGDSTSSETSLDTGGLGGVGNATVEVIIYNADGLQVDTGTVTQQIGPF